MFGIGMSEMLIIGVIALILIGPDQIPETARTLGKFLNELKRSTDDLKSHLVDEVKLPTSIDEIIAHSNKINQETGNHPEEANSTGHQASKFENHPHVVVENAPSVEAQSSSAESTKSKKDQT